MADLPAHIDGEPVPDDLGDEEVWLLARLMALDADGAPPLGAASGDPAWLATLWDDQSTARHLDVAARHLRRRGVGYYTIGSAGHEANAIVGGVTRVDDPALLHYRSAGFFLARARRAGRGRLDAVDDVVAGLVAARDDPASGGRHKVFGHPDLAVIPQTSTIASHLPRALGVAIAVGRARRLGLESPWGHDAVAVCSFGDASLNHSTAQGAINAVRYSAHLGIPVPLVLVCEDNGLGISVASPGGWVRRVLQGLAPLRLVEVDGADPVATRAAVEDLVEAARRGSPGVVHLHTVRYGGHAGSDVERAYRDPTSIRADLERDPLLGTARALIVAGVATGVGLAAAHLRARREVLGVAQSRAGAPTLSSANEVMAPLAPRRPRQVADDVAAHRPKSAPPSTGATMADAINRALGEVLEARPETLVFGEDVGRKGGVYGVTRGLARRFGAARVFDTLLDEQSVLGMALGAAVSGFVPIAEIQYLAYLHNAEDQLRGEAASLTFFSDGAFGNGMVVRIAGLAYQRGFGGHFHNDNSVAVLRDIPGLVVGCPSTPTDAAAMVHTLVAAAAVDRTVSVLLEPIALYHRRDVDVALDVGTDAHVAIGRAAGRRHGDDVTIVTFGNGVHMSMAAARRLAERGIDVSVVDLRWLAPLPIDDVLAGVERTGRAVIVDETRRTGGVGEALVAGLVLAGFDGPIELVAARDSFIPIGPAAETVLVDEAAIEEAIVAVAGRPRP